MPENLLTPTSIKLYGRPVNGLTLAMPPVPAGAYPAGSQIGANNFLYNQLTSTTYGTPGLARIYAFSYEGHTYDLPKPAIFLVHGAGTQIKTPSHTNMDAAGVARKEWEFSATAAGDDLYVWEYEKADFSLRLDIESGPFEEILLAACLRGGPAYSSGSDLRMSGSDLRMSGSDLRMSGSDLRMSGSDLRRR